jgi:DNA-binding NtrC family response regulator
VELAEKHPEIELLFTDVVLRGGLNGRALADEIARLRPGLPVLYTTGYTVNAIVHHGRLDSGMHLIGKPYTYAELSSKVRRMLDGA